MTYKKLLAQEKKAENLLAKINELRKRFDAEEGFEDVSDKLDGAYNSLDWAIERMYEHEQKMQPYGYYN